MIIEKIKGHLKDKDKRVLLENMLSLASLRVANYVLPLVVLPYLVRVLGVEKFGLIAFAFAFVQYFVILTEYGFNFSATREISVNRGNKHKIQEIFSSVMLVKLALMVISFFILVALVTTIPKFKNDHLVYFYAFGMVLGKIFFPVWFFQGMEKMRYITFLNVLSKLIFTVCIFLFIRTEQDYIYVPIMNSLGFILAGIAGLIVVRKDFGIRFTIPGFESITHQVKEGWHISISKIAISFYTTLNIFILGLFTNNIVVGYYAAGEKIIRVITELFNPVFEAFYPYISKIAFQSREQAIRYLLSLIHI